MSLTESLGRYFTSVFPRLRHPFTLLLLAFLASPCQTLASSPVEFSGPTLDTATDGKVYQLGTIPMGRLAGSEGFQFSIVSEPEATGTVLEVEGSVSVTLSMRNEGNKSAFVGRIDPAAGSATGDPSVVFRFDELSEDSGFGTISKVEVERDVGRLGHAGVFNGATSYARTPHAMQNPTAVSLLAWVKPTAGTGPGTLVALPNAAGDSELALGLDVSSGTVRWVVKQQSRVVASPLPSDTWTHLALVYDGFSVSTFVDGTPVDQLPLTAELAFDGCDVFVGATVAGPSCQGGFTQFLAGSVDDVQVFDRALTSKEIQARLAGTVPFHIAIEVESSGEPIRFAVEGYIQEQTSVMTPGPLRRVGNKPFFVDANGRGVFLAGSHTWDNLQEWGNPGQTFDYRDYLQTLRDNGHNFFRLWAWESRNVDWPDNDEQNINPLPWRVQAGKYQFFKRCIEGLHPGCENGLSADDGNDFETFFNNVNFNEAYFEGVLSAQKSGEPIDVVGLKKRVQAARDMWVGVMLFQGHSIPRDRDSPSQDRWAQHPFNPNNNMDFVDGAGFAVEGPTRKHGQQFHRLNLYQLPNFISGQPCRNTCMEGVVAFLQRSYVRRAVEVLSFEPNVLWEVSNESMAESETWQGQVIDWIRELELDGPIKHPVGMTAGGGLNSTVVARSSADWISPRLARPLGCSSDNSAFNPAEFPNKVVIADTDHVPCILDLKTTDSTLKGTYRQWIWRNLVRGFNVAVMDAVQNDARPFSEDPLDNRAIWTTNSPHWAATRFTLGQSRFLADRLDLEWAVPETGIDVCSNSLCIHDSNFYIVYQPDDQPFNLELPSDLYQYEWLNPRATGPEFETFTDPSWRFDGGDPVQFTLADRHGRFGCSGPTEDEHRCDGVLFVERLLQGRPAAGFEEICAVVVCFFDASSSSADAGIAGYTWDFGDGSTGSGVMVSHSYATCGSHNVTLTVTDNLGQTDTEIRSVAASGATAVSATDGTHADRIKVSWNAVAGANQYEIFRHTSNDSSSALQLPALVETTFFDDTTATPGVVYYYWVKAVTDDCESGFSNVDTGLRANTGQLTLDATLDADSWVNQTAPNTNYGAGTSLRVRSADTGFGRHAYLKFTVPDFSGTLQSAKLRIRTQSNDLPSTRIYHMGTTNWAETTINWNNAPLDVLTNHAIGALTGNTWHEIDVTSIITGNGSYTLGLVAADVPNLGFWSRESSYRPALAVTYQPSAIQTRTFQTAADAWVNQLSPNANYGAVSNLLVRSADTGQGRHSYLKFNVTGVTGAVQSAKLRIRTLNTSIPSSQLYQIGTTTWSENTINWNNAPLDVLTNYAIGALTGNTWHEIDVTSIITGNGSYTLGLVAADVPNLGFRSRESSYPPTLSVTYRP